MKTKIFLIIFIVCFITLSACSIKESAVNEINIEGQLVKTEKNKGLWPKWLLGDNLYARDHDFNLWRGKLTEIEWQKADTAFLCGHGHNEFGYTILSEDNKGALYVLNLPLDGGNLLSLTKIQQADSITNLKVPTNWEKYNLERLSSFSQNGDTFVTLSDSTILVTGTPANDLHHVLSIINFKNQTFSPLDYWPEDGTPENLTEKKWMVYTSGSGVKGNSKGRFLYWDDSGKLAFIFSIEGTKTNILSQIYSDHLPVQGIDKTPSVERIHCCANNERIYLLYKNSNSKGEKLVKFDMKDPFPMGNTVEVYNWDGIKQQIIHLDKFGREIMLSDDSKTLYLYSDEMNDGSVPYIYSYSLSPLN